MARVGFLGGLVGNARPRGGPSIVGVKRCVLQICGDTKNATGSGCYDMRQWRTLTSMGSSRSAARSSLATAPLRSSLAAHSSSVVANGQSVRHFATASNPNAAVTSVNIEWSPTKLPNPRTHPAECGRPNVTSSNICDPDNILSKDGKDVVEGHLNGFFSHCVVVAVNKMDSTFISKHPNVNAAAKYFAMSTHDAWGIGDKDRQDGVLVFLSVKDRVVFISTGKGVEGRLNPVVISAITTNMMPFLRSGNYDQALECCVLEIDGLLKNLVTAEEVIRDAEEGKNYDKVKNTQSSSSSGSSGSSANDDKESIFATMMHNIWIPALLVVAYVLWTRDKPGVASKPTLEQSRQELDTIYETDDVSCPFCLRKYDESNVGGRGKIKLGCGHTYCVKCYGALTKESVESGTPCVCGVCMEKCVPINIAGKSSVAGVGDAIVPVQTPSSVSTGAVTTPDNNVRDRAIYYNIDPGWWLWGSRGAPSGSNASDQAPAKDSKPAQQTASDEARMKSALHRLRRYQEKHGHNVSPSEIESIRRGIARGEQQTKAVIEARKKTIDKRIEARNENLARQRMQDEKRREEARKSGSSGSSSNDSWGSGGKSSGGGGASW
jgi:uncharacterized membrane protein YgcG